MIDLPMTLGAIRKAGGSEAKIADMTEHLSMQHLTPDKVGLMGERAEPREIVITHLVAKSAKAQDLVRYVREIHRHYRGKVVIARDLDRF